MILSSKVGASDLKRARDFIGKLTSRSALLDIEEILPKLIDYVKSAKIDHGLEKLRNSLEKIRLREQRRVWNHFRDTFNGMIRAQKLLRIIASRH